jgi:glutamate racemase
MSLKTCNNPIGVFDSGLGGLTVVKELMHRLPFEDIIYYGDTARVPYGTKSKESIIRFSVENTTVLLKYKVKMVVVACNSSSSYALEVLKDQFPVPIVGVIHAGAKKAVKVTQNKRIGVIATSATISSEEYVKTVKLYDQAVKVFSRACPLFVPLAEEGWFRKPVTLDIAREYLSSLKKAEVDTLILGCTHYPLLRSVLHTVMGKKVVLVDSAKEVADEVKRLLAENGVGRAVRRKPNYKFLVSDQPQQFQKIAKNFLGYEINAIRKVS